MLANPDPSYTSENVVLERHISDGVVGNVAGKIMPETQFVPNRTCNHTILRHVLPKCLESSLGGWIWCVSRVGLEGSIKPVNIGTAVDVGFSHNAGFKGESVYANVHLRMGGVEECFFHLRSEGWGADGREWDMVDKCDLPSRFRGRGEDIDGTGKGTGGNGDVRIKDPEDVVLCFSVWAYEVIDLGIYSDHLLTCSACRSATPEGAQKVRHVPMITRALKLGYFSKRVWTTGRAWSYSFATEKMISKLGYSWWKVDSRFSNKLVSSPFSGRRIETPGTDSGGAELLGDVGRGERYLRRLTQAVRTRSSHDDGEND